MSAFDAFKGVLHPLRTAGSVHSKSSPSAPARQEQRKRRRSRLGGGVSSSTASGDTKSAVAGDFETASPESSCLLDAANVCEDRKMTRTDLTARAVNKVMPALGPIRMPSGHNFNGSIQQLQHFLDDLKGSDSLKREKAAALLGNLALKPSNVEPMVDAGVVEVLVEAAADRQSQKVAERAFKALSSIIYADDKHAEVVYKAGGVKVLSDSIDCGGPQLAEVSAVCLMAMASCMDESTPLRQAYPARSALGALVDQLHHRDKAKALIVASALSDVPAPTWGGGEDYASRALQGLLALMNGTSSAEREHAAWALWNLASTVDLSSQLAEGIPVFVALASSGSDRGREVGAWLLWTVCSSSDYSSDVSEAGAAKALMKSLACGGGACQEAAAWAIWALATGDPASVKELKHLGAVEALKALQTSDSISSSAKEAATGALAAFSDIRRSLRKVGNYMTAHSPLRRGASGGRSNSTATNSYPPVTPGSTSGASTPFAPQGFQDTPVSCFDSGTPRASMTPGAAGRLAWGAANSPGPMSLRRQGSSPFVPRGLRLDGGATPRARTRFGNAEVSSPSSIRMKSAALRLADGGTDGATEISAAISTRLDPEAEAPVPKISVARLYADLPEPSKQPHRKVQEPTAPADEPPSLLGGLLRIAIGRPARSDAAAAVRTVTRSRDTDQVLAALTSMEETASRGSDEEVEALVAAGAVDAASTLVKGNDTKAEVRRGALQVLHGLSRHRSAQPALCQSTAAAAMLVKASVGATPKSQQAAVGALANIAGDAEVGSVLARQMDGQLVEAVAHLVYEGSSREARIQAACTLGNLCVDAGGRRLILEQGGVKPLVAMLRHGSMASKVAAATALRNLAADREGQLAVEAAGGIPPLSALVGVEDPEGRLAAAKALVNVSALGRCASAALKAGAVSHLVWAVGPKETEELRLAAAEALQNLGASSAAPSVLSGTGAVAALVRASTGRGSPALVSALVKTVGNLCVSGAMRAEAVKAGALQVAVQLLHSPATQEAAARALRNLGLGADNQRELVELGVCPMLASALREGRSDGRATAAALATWNLAMAPVASAALVSAGCVDLLIQLVEMDDPEMRTAAAGALANFSSQPVGREAVLMKSGHKTLVRAVAAREPRHAVAAEQAARALRNLAASSPQALHTLSRAGAIPALLELVSKGTPAGRELAVCALHPFVSDKEGAVQLSKLNASQILLEHGLASDTASVGLRDVSLTALRSLVPKPEFRHLMASPAAMEGLVELMVHGQKPAQEVAAYVMWDVLVRTEPDGTKLKVELSELVKCGAVEGLAMALHSGTENARQAAAGALKELTSEESLQSAITELLHEIKHQDTTLERRARAARSLASLTHRSDEAVMAVAISGAVRLLINAVDIARADELRAGPDLSSLREAGARCLWNLSRDPELARLIAREGAITALVDLLATGDPGPAAAAAGALSNLSSAADNRSVIAGRGGIELLIQLASVGAEKRLPGVCASASGAIRNLCAHTGNARVAVSAGAVPALTAVAVAKLGPVASEAALAALANLAAIDMARDCVAEDGAVAAAVLLLEASRDQTGEEQQAMAESAARMLRCLVGARRHRATVVDAGAVRPLLSIAKRHGVAVKREAVGCLRLLAACVEGKSAILEAGGAEALVWLLRDKDPRVQEAVAYTIWNFCYQTPANREAAAAAGGINALLGVLKSGSPASHRPAAGALCDVAGQPSVVDKALRAGAVPVLLRTIEAEAGGQEEAAWAIASLAASPSGRRELMAHCAAITLVRVLAVGNSTCKEAAAWATNTLAMEAPYRQPLVAAGALPVLLRLAKDPVITTREAAAVAYETLQGQNAKGGKDKPPLAPSQATSGQDTEVRRQLFSEDAGRGAMQQLGGPSSAQNDVKSKARGKSKLGREAPASAAAPPPAAPPAKKGKSTGSSQNKLKAASGPVSTEMAPQGRMPHMYTTTSMGGSQPMVTAV